MIPKTSMVLQCLKEISIGTTDDIHKHIVRRYGKSIPSLSTILEVLVELGHIQIINKNGQTYYTLRQEPKLLKIKEEVSHENNQETEENTPIPQTLELSKPIPLNRDYDWEDFIPDGEIPEYIPQGSELKKLEVCNRLRIEGPPGCGKTLMVEWFCYKNKLPLFQIQGYGAHISDLIGRPWIQNNTAYWVDGILTQAILCSKEMECVLMVDEFNRMDPREQAAFLSIADYRCQLQIPATSETIRGNPNNLKIILTMNVGTEYFVHRLDDAVRRRFPQIELDFLGLVNPELEMKAVMKQSGVKKNLAKLLVEAANKIRLAAKSEKSTIKKGIPTHNVIEWAKLALGYRKVGIENPLIEAGLDAVASYYDGIARKEVEQIIISYCDLTKSDERKYW